MVEAEEVEEEEEEEEEVVETTFIDTGSSINGVGKMRQGLQEHQGQGLNPIR